MGKRTTESQILKTNSEVMAALGGIHRIAELTGCDWKNVETWSRAKTFPARYFLVMWLELVSLGVSAPPSLWGQTLSRNKEAVMGALARKIAEAA